MLVRLPSMKLRNTLALLWWVFDLHIFSKEVTIVKWSDRQPVFDIRAWRVSDTDGLQYPLRGITFSKDELIKLREILNSIDVNCIDEYM